MEEGIPYFAIGNNELAILSRAGKTATCPICKKQHKIKYGKKKTPDGTWEETKDMGFIDCGKESYLVSVNGKLL